MGGIDALVNTFLREGATSPASKGAVFLPTLRNLCLSQQNLMIFVLLEEADYSEPFQSDFRLGYSTRKILFVPAHGLFLIIY